MLTNPVVESVALRGSAFGQGCGILRHETAAGAYHHRRHAPPEALADWIEHIWMEDWKFASSSPQTREVLPHPNVHLTFSATRSRIYGVQLGRLVRQLDAEGSVVGVKFRGGAFHPFLRKPVSSIANGFIAAADVFADAADGARAVMAAMEDAQRVRAVVRFLEPHLPPRDRHVAVAAEIVGEIARDRSITRVEQVVARCGMKERTLQRLFDRYVGASARWVIKRYRVYEALESMRPGAPIEWAALAQDLGYFDQAHFINDFKKLVGCLPSEYVRPLGLAA
jgi:AraC-like DNA-binding protein